MNPCFAGDSATRSRRLVESPAILAALCLVSACSPRGDGATDALLRPGEIVLIDYLGRSVRLSGPAQRIVSLAPAHTETLFALNAAAQIVGRDSFSDYPAAAQNVESIGNVYPRVNVEVILLLRPDLVLASGITSADDVFALARVGLTVYATDAARSLDDVYDDILAVARLAGHVAEGERLVTSLKERVEVVRMAVGRTGVRPDVYYELDATDPAKPWIPGPGSFIDELIELAGGRNIGDAGNDDYFQVSLEELVARDPDIIVLGSATHGSQSPESVKARPGWQSMTALKSGAVYLFDDNLVSRPGPRVVLGLETLARRIHPNLFP